MKRTLCFIVIFAAIGCGGQSADTDTPGAVSLLPAELSMAGLTRSTDVQVFTGDSLYQYIDGGAELYHAHGFVEVATADYASGENEFTIDVYRFNSVTNAYGLFQELRSPYASPLAVGIEGMASAGNVKFVKGSYVVNIVAYDESNAATLTLAKVAAELSQKVPGTTEKPNMTGE